MRFGRVLLAVASLMGAVSGCAGNLDASAIDADQRLRIFSVDFDAASRRAVFEVCRVGEHAQGERGRVCQLGWADLGSADVGVFLTPAVRHPGQQYYSAVLVPGGRVLYASRRATADWRAHLYDSPSQIVRIDLADGSETEVARAETGLLTLVDVFPASDGSEALILLETRPAANPQHPSNGSRFRTMRIQNGIVADGSARILDDIGGAGFEMRVPGYGYLRQAEDRRRGGLPALFAVRTSDVAAGRYEVVDTLEAAIRYVTGCGGEDCASSVQRRAHSVAPRLTPEMRTAGYGPETVVAEFPDRNPIYFPDQSGPWGATPWGMIFPEARSRRPEARSRIRRESPTR